MEMGQIVDFVIEYNRMHGEDGGPKGAKKENKPKRRMATQADWDAFLG